MSEIRWRASLSATCMHAAACWRAGIPAADPALAAALDPVSAALVQELDASGWPVDDVMGQLMSLAADFENNRELVTRTFARLRVPLGDEDIGWLAGAVADLEAALRRLSPEIVEELDVRGRPLREQWHARGAGMLHEIARLTDAAAVPEAAEIVLVAPYAGGQGWAHAAQNRVTLEAVLVNPHPELPEPVRLAWLVGQLNQDLPRFADVLSGAVAPAAFQLAMLAPALAGAAAVEWGQCDEAAIDAAIDAWRLRDGLPPDAATRLWGWWSAWLEGEQRWEVAVAALAALMELGGE